MVQETRTTTDGSGNGVVIGILLAVVIGAGAFFFIKSNDTASVEPAAGIESPAGDTDINVNVMPENTPPAPTPAP